ARPGADPPGEIERRAIVHHELRALPAAVGRREEEDATHADVGATERANSGALSVFSTSSRRTPPRRARATPYLTFASSPTEWASVDTTKRMPRARAATTQRGGRSSRRGSPLISTAAWPRAAASSTSSTRHSIGGRERTRRPSAWPHILKQ